jgi:O6-methylguanine-DNA--protein-cysteine methyltransferase
MSLFYKYCASPLGKLKLVASETGLIAILWENDNPRRVPLTGLVEDNDQKILVETERQLKEYFSDPARHARHSIPERRVASITGDPIWHDAELWSNR